MRWFVRMLNALGERWVPDGPLGPYMFILTAAAIGALIGGLLKILVTGEGW